MEKFYNTADAAAEMDITPDLLRHYLRAGKIPGAFKRGGTRYSVPRQAIDEYLCGQLDLSGTFRNWRNRFGKGGG